MAPTEVDFRCQANKRGTDRRCKLDSLQGSSYCKYHQYEDAGCYIIKLTSDKWYVGHSKNVQARINEHRESIAEPNHGTPLWIKRHPPVDPLEYEIRHKYTRKPANNRNRGNNNEDKLTFETMKKYGIENVRGGNWVMVHMKESDRKEIESFIEKE